MTVETAPFIVLDDEPLIRECSSGNIAGGGRVKPRAFVATKEPLEISVHRDRYCDEACRGRADAAVSVVAGAVRQLPSEPTVRSEVPPIDHALIEISGVPGVKTMADLAIEEHAAIASRHTALCRELASIAVACSRVRFQSSPS